VRNERGDGGVELRASALWRVSANLRVHFGRSRGLIRQQLATTRRS
jgi:hypothetical protein